MRTHSRSRVLPFLLSALALVGSRQPAGASTGPNVGPIAGPIELSTAAEVVSFPVGSLLETTILVENHGATAATVFLLGRIVWPDGSTQLQRYGPPVTVDGNGAFLLSALGPIPDDAGSGAGTFTATAFVGALGPGGHGSQGGRLIARSSSGFVLP